MNFRDDKAKTVTSSIHLPTVVVNESNQILGKISWETSEPDIMANDGTVYMQPATGESPYRLTLTATITAGETTVTKEYEVAVLHSVETKAFPGAQGYGTLTYAKRRKVQEQSYLTSAVQLTLPLWEER